MNFDKAKYILSLVKKQKGYSDLTCCDYLTEWLILYLRGKLLLDKRGKPVYNARCVSLAKLYGNTPDHYERNLQDMPNNRTLFYPRIPLGKRQRFTNYPISDCAEFLRKQLQLHPGKVFPIVVFSDGEWYHSFSLFFSDKVYIIDAYLFQRQPSVREFDLDLFEELLGKNLAGLWEKLFLVKLKLKDTQKIIQLSVRVDMF